MVRWVPEATPADKGVSLPVHADPTTHHRPRTERGGGQGEGERGNSK